MRTSYRIILRLITVSGLLSPGVMSVSINSPPRNQRTRIKRQEVITATAGTTTSQSTASSTSNGQAVSSSISLSIVIPVVVILVVLVVFAMTVGYRASIRSWLGKRFPSLSSQTHVNGDNAGQSMTTSSTRTLTALELTSGSPASRRTRQNGVPGNEGSGDGTPSSRGGRGRRLQRTSSGRSVRTLPAYSKQPGEEELVLVRQRSSSSSMEGGSDETASPAHAGHPLLPSITLEEADHPSSISIHDNSDPLRNTGASDLADSPPHTAPIGPPPVRNSTIGRRGWGEAPSYLEAMSTPDLRLPAQIRHAPVESLPSSSYSSTNDPEATAGVPPPRTPVSGGTSRSRTGSGFKDFLSRTGLHVSSGRAQRGGESRRPSVAHSHSHSLSSLLLQPQSSRTSTFSPYSNTNSPIASPSPGIIQSPWQSTTSLIISSPLPNSAYRASFDSSNLPRGGLSDLQMRFLGSSEALTLAGVRIDDPPPGRRRRGGSDATLLPGSGAGSPRMDEVEGNQNEDGDGGAESPPTWDQVEGERRRGEAFERRNLARPFGLADQEAGEGGEGPSHATDVGNHQSGGTIDITTSKVAGHPRNNSVSAPEVEIQPPTPLSATHYSHLLTPATPMKDATTA